MKTVRFAALAVFGWIVPGGAYLLMRRYLQFAGFAVLVLSDIRMLRDFGLVTLIDLSVSLVGVLVALPAALMIAGILR